MSGTAFLRLRTGEEKNKPIGNIIPTSGPEASTLGGFAWGVSWALWFIFIAYILTSLGFFWFLLIEIDQDVDNIEKQNVQLINITNTILIQTTEIDETTMQILNNTNCSVCEKLDIIIDIVSPGHHSSFCDDDNPCTADIIKFGVCRNFNKPNLTPCLDHCFNPGSHCFNGHCTGICKGACVFSSDCPTLTSFFPLTKNCLDGACIYTHITTVPPLYNNSCFEESNILKQVCTVGLTDPKKDCLNTEVQCDAGNNMTCFHSFDCSRLHIVL